MKMAQSLDLPSLPQPRDQDPPNVTILYRVMQSAEGRLGGGEGVEGLYGSITQSGMHRILSCLLNNCGLNTNSIFVDIGSGLCRPLLHALIWPGVLKVLGVEVDPIKCAKAKAFSSQTLHALASRGIHPASDAFPEIVCSAVEQVGSLDSATHAYSFWEGIPISAKEAFGDLFRRSKSLKAVAVVQRSLRKQNPAAMMHELGFGPLLLIAQLPVKMSGSGRSFSAYVFSKITPESAALIEGAVCRPLMGGEDPVAVAAAALPEKVGSISLSGASLSATKAVSDDGQGGMVTLSNACSDAEATETLPAGPAEEAASSPAKRGRAVAAPCVELDHPASATAAAGAAASAGTAGEGSPLKRSKAAMAVVPAEAAAAAAVELAARSLAAAADAKAGSRGSVAQVQTTITHSYGTRRKLAVNAKEAESLTRDARGSKTAVPTAADRGFGLGGRAAAAAATAAPEGPPQELRAERKSGRQR